jgi:sugar lactone lactonase YvrE
LLWAGAGPQANLSPDGKTLYVGESDTREIWSYRIDGARLLSPRLVTRFADFDIDGLRTDISANLHVARNLEGHHRGAEPNRKTAAGNRAQGQRTDRAANSAFRAASDRNRPK